MFVCTEVSLCIGHGWTLVLITWTVENHAAGKMRMLLNILVGMSLHLCAFPEGATVGHLTQM